MKKIDVEYYIVYESYDRDYREVANFSSYSDAYAFANRSPYYSADRKAKIRTIVIFDSLAEYDDYTEERKKQNAINKLTDEERKLLGIK